MMEIVSLVAMVFALLAMTIALLAMRASFMSLNKDIRAMLDRQDEVRKRLDALEAEAPGHLWVPSL